MNSAQQRKVRSEISSFRVFFARTSDELDCVDALWRAVYGRELGWRDPTAPGKLYMDAYHEQSSYLVVEANGQPVGTMRLVADSEAGLPVEQFFVPGDMKQGRKIIECQRLMVLGEQRELRHPAGAPFGIYPCLIKAALQFCLQNAVTHVVADLFVDTDTTPMESLGRLGFARVGEPFVDRELREASPSVALLLEVSQLLAQIFRSKAPLERYLVLHDDYLQIYDGSRP